VARRKLACRKEPRLKSPVVFTLKPGEVVQAETGFVLTLACGKARAIREIRIGSRRASAGQTVCLLHYSGEGFYTVWFEGATGILEVLRKGERDAEAALVEIKAPKVAWWVKVRNASGKVGWTSRGSEFGNKDLLAKRDSSR